MSSNLKSSPTFKAEGDDYLSWKTDLEVWELYTDLEKKKRGPAVYLQLEGKARDAVREFKPEDIGKDTGLKSIMDKLDEVYLKDKNTLSYTAFKEFYEYKRSSGEKYSEFMLKFEQLYNKMAKYDMHLHEGVKAFFLLNAVNMSIESEKLARATVAKCYVC